MIYFLFIIGAIVSFEAYERYKNSRIDIDAIAIVAVAIRREKNKRYVELVSNLPDCPICGPGYRHFNIVPE